MTFTPKEFKYSNIDDTKLQRFPSVEAGPQFLIIENATYDPETEIFDVMFRSLSNEAKFRIRSFMLGKDGKPNYISVHWHNMLGLILFRPHKVSCQEILILSRHGECHGENLAKP